MARGKEKVALLKETRDAALERAERIQEELDADPTNWSRYPDRVTNLQEAAWFQKKIDRWENGTLNWRRLFGKTRKAEKIIVQG